MNSRGQVSMEFIVSILMILAFFLFGLFVFQQRTDYNASSTHKWLAQETAYKISRNINNAYLLDDNASITESIVWNSKGQSVSWYKKTITVLFGSSSAQAPLAIGNVDFRVTDFNGFIVFRKSNGSVIVSYP